MIFCSFGITKLPFIAVLFLSQSLEAGDEMRGCGVQWGGACYVVVPAAVHPIVATFSTNPKVGAIGGRITFSRVRLLPCIWLFDQCSHSGLHRLELS
jgi:hypothetical protein